MNQKILSIIKLSGNNRLPHLEEEIFADNELAREYMNNLDQGSPYFNIVPRILHYAERTLGHRWPAVEPFILKYYIKHHDCYWPSIYAECVIKGRWFELEKLVLDLGIHRLIYVSDPGKYLIDFL